MGIVTKTLKDGTGATFTANFWDDGTALNPVSVPFDTVTGLPFDATAAAPVKGGTAADAALANPPVTVGGRAATANPTAVAGADVVDAMFDKLGKQVVVPAIRTLKASQTTTITSSTAETTIVTAVASTFLDIFRLVITNTSVTACNVTIKDDTAGTTRWVFAVPAGQTVGFSADAGSATPQLVVNKPWTATCSASVASIIITAETVANI